MISVAGLLVDSAAGGGYTILECIERFLVFFCVFRAGFRRWLFNGFRYVFFLFYGFRYVCLLFPLLLYGFRRWTFGGFCRRRRINDFRMCRAIPRFLFF